MPRGPSVFYGGTENETKKHKEVINQTMVTQRNETYLYYLHV